MSADLQTAVENIPFWYHTMDLGDGVVTPGWFDLRPVVRRLPWPDIRGKRCLDIGTADGFYAFELERRGASEVVATDISDHTQWDWQLASREEGPEWLAKLAGPKKGEGFRIAKKALGSSVQRVELNVYDLSPDELGNFDLVVCGSVLIHLRDPLRALAAIRSVCMSRLMSIEAVDLRLTLVHRRLPVQRLEVVEDSSIWSMPNVAGHSRMLRMAGFMVERATGAYAEPYGVAHPKRHKNLRVLRRTATQLALARGIGVPHNALLASPG